MYHWYPIGIGLTAEASEFQKPVDMTQNQISVEWKIPEFMLLDTKDCVTSPEFSFAGAVWVILIYPQGDKSMQREDDEGMGLYLVKKTLLGRRHHVQYRLGIHMCDGTVSSSSDAKDAVFCSKKYRHGHDCIESIDNEIADYGLHGPHQTLKVFCEIRLLTTTGESSTQTREREALHLEKLSENLKDLCTSGRVSDVKVKVKGQEFQVHKSLLAAWSPVFTSLLETDTEKISNAIEIDDCDPDTFKYFLDKLYAGKMDDISTLDVCGVYKIAAKYDLKQMKAECVDHLLRDISIDSFCDIALVAHVFKDTRLLKPVCNFFITHMKEILEADSWPQFAKDHYVIANELLQSLVPKK